MHTSYTYIDEKAALQRLTDRLKKADRIALDTEADSLHHYYEKVCLIQISLQDEHFIVDPLAGLDLSPFLEQLSSKPLVLHGADYDMRILHSSYDFVPGEPVFDTMLAAQLLGFPHLGLSALVAEFFEVELQKQSQRYNWSLRPIPEAERIYASDDTRYLEEMACKLEDLLVEKGRLDWHRETCEAMKNAAMAEKEKPDPDKVWLIKGLQGLGARELAFVRELWHWRETGAQHVDLPPFKVLGNQQLIALAVWGAAHPSVPLHQGPRLPRNIRGGRKKALEATLRKAQQLPESAWPRFKRKRTYPPTAEEVKRINRLRSAVADLAGKLELEPSVVAPRAAIESIVRNGARDRQSVLEHGRLLGWQTDLILDSVDTVMD